MQSAPLIHNLCKAQRSGEAQSQVFVFSPNCVRHWLHTSRPGPAGKRDAPACGEPVGSGAEYGQQGVCELCCVIGTPEGSCPGAKGLGCFACTGLWLPLPPHPQLEEERGHLPAVTC